MNEKKQKKEKKSKAERESLKKRLKTLLPSFIAILFFSFLLGLFGALKNSPKVNEFMVTKVSRSLLMITGRATSAFPFSMYELFLYIVVFAVILCIVRIIIMLAKRRFIRALHVVMSMMLTALIISSVYFVAAGFSYHRYEEYFPTYNPTLSLQETVEIADYFIDDFNQIAGSLERDEKGYAIMPYSVSELADKMRVEYLRHQGYNINDFTPKCKTILSSSIMSEMHVVGVFFAPFGEVNINALIPKHEMPFTMAHEIAHAKGVMRENDADQLALYITLTSNDPFVRYSGYSEMIFTLLDAVWTYERLEGYTEKPEYNRLIAKISPLIRNDWNAGIEFWNKYNRWERINDFIDMIYDNYLKLMGQKEGSGAYIPPPTDVVEQPKVDPETGGVIIDPGTGKPETELKPSFTVIQQIFFEAHRQQTS